MNTEFHQRLEQLQIDYPDHGYVCASPAARWEDGTIVGNGTQGALCFARPHDEEIVLSHEALFLPIYPKREFFHLAPHMDHLRELVFANQGGEAMAFTMDLAKAKGYERRTLTDPFIGACSLQMTHPASECSRYARSTDFASGSAMIAWEDEAGIFHRRLLASRATPLVAIELSSPTRAPCSATLELARIAQGLDPDFYNQTVAATDCTSGENQLGFHVRLHSFAGDQALQGYHVCLRAVPTEGESSTRENTLEITGAERLLLLIAIEPVFAGQADPLEYMQARLAATAEAYDTLLTEHASIHSEYFGRLSLQLCDKTEEKQETTALQSAARPGKTPLALIQKTFEAGRYGTIASTGRLPPALQGIWTGTWRPNWSGDFTLNGNVQSAVASSLPGNHSECLRATLDYLSGLMDDFKVNARELFGWRGIYIPWRSSTHGQCHYAGHRDGHNAFPGTYWFGGTAWWAWFYYEYWCYTGDTAFFETQLKPFFLEAADFYEDYLTVERDGRLVLIPSYSPENAPANAHCLQPNATMTIAAVRQFLRTALLVADSLGVPQQRQEVWRTLQRKLPPYTIDENGALSEWSWPGIKNNENHRHASHLYPVYDEVAPEIAESPALREACRVAIERRLEYRRPKDGAEMSFGIVQLGMAAGYLRETDLALECVEWLVNSYWSPAMVSQHDPDAILNLDISGGLPAVILNMLVQSGLPRRAGDPWRISLLPCLPERWASGSLSGVRCRGGFELSFRWEENALTALSITSLRGERCVVEFDGREEPLDLHAGESKVLL